MEAGAARRNEAIDDGPPIGEAAKVLDFERRRREIAEYSGPVMTEAEARRIDERPGRMTVEMAVQASKNGMG